MDFCFLTHVCGDLDCLIFHLVSKSCLTEITPFLLHFYISLDSICQNLVKSFCSVHEEYWPEILSYYLFTLDVRIVGDLCLHSGRYP